MMDVNEEFKKLDAVEVKLMEENEEVKSLLNSINTSCKNIKMGEVNIRIKAFMPKKLRSAFMKVGGEVSKIEGIEGLDAVEREFYPLVAQMCVDAPFNNAKTWQFIDERQGCITEVVMKIIAEVNSTDVKIKSFR
jgi:hypothetical protein